MENFVLHLVHAAAWIFGFVFLFAVIGILATIRFIAGLFTRAETAVVTGVHSAENIVTRRHENS